MLQKKIYDLRLYFITQMVKYSFKILQHLRKTENEYDHFVYNSYIRF